MNHLGPLEKTLNAHYEVLRKRNPSYSIRAFARKLGITPGTLSLLMLGKRKVSEKMALKIADNLPLGPQERSEILANYLDAKLIKAHTGDYLELSQDQYNISAEWQYFAILNLIKTKDFKSDVSWIAQRLGLKKSEVTEALDRLERLGLIKYDEENNIGRQSSKYRTPDEVVSVALKKCHHQGLDLAHESLDRDPVSERDFTTVTFPLNPKKISEAKALIRKFEDDLVDLLEKDDDLTEVYRLAIQLFPLTKTPRKKP